MLEVKKSVFPSPEQWDIAVKGVRNAFKSWEKGDSHLIWIEPRIDDPATTHYLDGAVVGREYNLPDDYMEILQDKENYRLVGWVESEEQFRLGKEDRQLLKNLCHAGGGDPSHSKFLRQLPVTLDIRAPLYWWKQMDKYQIGTVTNSESTMHTIMKHEFSIEDFSFDHSLENTIIRSESDFYDYVLPVDIEKYVVSTIQILNELRDEYLELKRFKEQFIDSHRGKGSDPNLRQGFAWRIFEMNADSLEDYSDIELAEIIDRLMKRIWFNVIELQPESYNQTRTWSANYTVLKTIVRQRFGHLLPEWTQFIWWIWDNVPMAQELIFDDWKNKYESFKDWGMAQYEKEEQKQEFCEKLESILRLKEQEEDE